MYLLHFLLVPSLTHPRYIKVFCGLLHPWYCAPSGLRRNSYIICQPRFTRSVLHRSSCTSLTRLRVRTPNWSVNPWTSHTYTAFPTVLFDRALESLPISMSSSHVGDDAFESTARVSSTFSVSCLPRAAISRSHPVTSSAPTIFCCAVLRLSESACSAAVQWEHTL